MTSECAEPDHRRRQLQALRGELRSIADARRAGALVSVDAEPRSLRRLRASGISTERAEQMVVPVAALVARVLGVETARVGWSRYQLVLRGTRDELAPQVQALAADLSVDPRTSELDWWVVATRIFPGAPDRTLWCDPGYDLVPVTCSAAFWVEPYAGPDWTEPQRYPTTTLIWRARPA